MVNDYEWFCGFNNIISDLCSVETQLIFFSRKFEVFALKKISNDEKMEQFLWSILKMAI